jgi:hypothetical protein
MRMEEGRKSSVPKSLAASEPPDPGCAIKGNVNHKGERIYFLPGQANYGAVDMSNLSKLGKRWFCSLEDAEKAGWRSVAP